MGPIIDKSGPFNTFVEKCIPNFVISMLVGQKSFQVPVYDIFTVRTIFYLYCSPFNSFLEKLVRIVCIFIFSTMSEGFMTF